MVLRAQCYFLNQWKSFLSACQYPSARYCLVALSQSSTLIATGLVLSQSDSATFSLNRLVPEVKRVKKKERRKTTKQLESGLICVRFIVLSESCSLRKRGFPSVSGTVQVVKWSVRIPNKNGQICGHVSGQKGVRQVKSFK